MAEVLITLGIIGVVAALTAPALVQNAGNSKVGPTLSKVVSTLENTNQQILQDQEASDLSKLSSDNYNASTGPSGTLPYMELLSQYISGSSLGSTTEITTSNTKYFNPAWTDYHGASLYHNVYIFNFSNNITLLM